MGMTGEYDEGSKGFGKLQYMVCRPENDFFPDLSKVADCCQCMSDRLIELQRQCRQACIGLLEQHCHMTTAGGKVNAYRQLPGIGAFTAGWLAKGRAAAVHDQQV